MASNLKSHRFIITVRGEEWPRLFTEEGPARQFFKQRKADVILFLEETLTAEFAGYYVWKQNRLHPPESGALESPTE